jgi:hypothetical protein
MKEGTKGKSKRLSSSAVVVLALVPHRPRLDRRVDQEIAGQPPPTTIALRRARTPSVNACCASPMHESGSDENGNRQDQGQPFDQERIGNEPLCSIKSGREAADTHSHEDNGRFQHSPPTNPA